MEPSHTPVGNGLNRQGIWPLEKPHKCFLTKGFQMIPSKHAQQPQSIDIRKKYSELLVMHIILSPRTVLTAVK